MVDGFFAAVGELNGILLEQIAVPAAYPTHGSVLKVKPGVAVACSIGNCCIRPSKFQRCHRAVPYVSYCAKIGGREGASC